VVTDAGYLVGSPAQGTVFIQDAPWDAWRLEHFTAQEIADPAVSGEHADPDQDRLPNLLEFAFHFDPRSPNESPGFSGAWENTGGVAGGQPAFVVRFPQRIAPSDLLYEVQVTTDFINWLSSPNVSRELLPRQPNPDGVTATTRVQIIGPAPSSPGQRLVRLRVRLLEGRDTSPASR
jgi:hypothetical protein